MSFLGETTGDFWKSLAYYLTAKGFDFVVVNSMHVKKSKELNDNSPTKNDTKDAKVCAVNQRCPIRCTKSLGWYVCR